MPPSPEKKDMPRTHKKTKGKKKTSCVLPKDLIDRLGRLVSQLESVDQMIDSLNKDYTVFKPHEKIKFLNKLFDEQMAQLPKETKKNKVSPK